MTAMTLDELINRTTAVQHDTGRWAPVAAGCLVVVVAEMVGTVAGLPTIVGWVHNTLGILGAGDFPGIRFVVMLLPQAVLLGVCALTIKRTVWPQWLAARARGDIGVRPLELQIPRTGVAVAIALLVWVGIAWDLGGVPAFPNWLLRGQLVIAALLTGWTLLTLKYRPREVVQITAIPGVHRSVEPMLFPIELEFPADRLPNLMILEQIPHATSYRVLTSRHVRIDNKRLHLIDLQALKSSIESPPIVASSTVFECQFHVEMMVSREHQGAAPLEARAVEGFIDNVVKQSDGRLKVVLTELVSRALLTYEGDVQEIRQRVAFDFDLFKTRLEARLMQDVRPTVPLPGAAPGVIDDANLLGDVVIELTRVLERIVEDWKTVEHREAQSPDRVIDEIVTMTGGPAGAGTAGREQRELALQAAVRRYVASHMEVSLAADAASIEALLTPISFRFKAMSKIRLNAEGKALDETLKAESRALRARLAEVSAAVAAAKARTDRQNERNERELFARQPASALRAAWQKGLETNPAIERLKGAGGSRGPAVDSAETTDSPQVEGPASHVLGEGESSPSRRQV